MPEQNEPSPSDSTGPSHDVDPAVLEHIVDDTEEIGDCREWIYEQFKKERDADSILAELIEGGWPADEAEAMVEAGRRATRHLRGAFTREEIARLSEKKYRKAFRSAFRVGMAALLVIGLTYCCTPGHFFNKTPVKSRQ